MPKRITISKEEFTDKSADALATFVFKQLEQMPEDKDKAYVLEGIGITGSLIIRIIRDRLFDYDEDTEHED